MNIPDLRFRGFEDEWVEKTIGDIAKINNGYDYKHLESGEIPVYGTGGYMLSVNRALSCVDAVGIGRKGTIDRPFILNAPFWTVDTLFYVTPNNDCDLYFLLGLFLNTDWKKRDESTGVPSLSKSTIEQVFTFQSSLDEQKKIGKVFERYDNLLTQCERRQTTLLNLKRALLDKMFPKDGNDVPEIRFAGFDGAWKLYRLAEITTSIGDGLHGTPKYDENGNTYFINGNNLSSGHINISEDTKKVPNDNSRKEKKLLSNNSILLSINGTIGNLAYYCNENIMLGKSVAYINTSNCLTSFLYTYLQTNQCLSYFNNNTTGTTIKNLGLISIRETPVPLPTLAEQQAIGRFFSHLDTLISLESQKLSKLRQLKKALLKRMFV